MIDGRTQLVGLVGWPVEHSLSPVMHNAAFKALGLNWRYLPFPVRPGRVEDALRGLAVLGIRGVNVTVPHKQTVLDFMDVIDPSAQKVDAVNTVVFAMENDTELRISGYNTDMDGFLGALGAARFEFSRGCKGLVVGAGGSAFAVVQGLILAGVTDITVLNRTPARAQALIERMRAKNAQEMQLRSIELSEDSLVEIARDADLLVNATTVGMWPTIKCSVWPKRVPMPPHLTVLDLVYNPVETLLLRQARDVGARAVDGLEMLVLQGARAFELWTGRPAPLDAMRSACHGNV